MLRLLPTRTILGFFGSGTYKMFPSVLYTLWMDLCPHHSKKWLRWLEGNTKLCEYHPTAWLFQKPLPPLCSLAMLLQADFVGDSSRTAVNKAVNEYFPSPLYFVKHWMIQEL